MIDEKKLIEYIESAIKTSNTRHNNYMSGLRNGMRYCLSLITGKETEFEECNQWIPCSERMPPEPNVNNTFDKKPVYLVSVNGEDYPYRALWNGRYFMDGFLILEAAAWMPLPEPYKAGD